MNLLGIVKDSFEAVVQEVESACQRDTDDPRNGEPRNGTANSPQTVQAPADSQSESVSTVEAAPASTIAAGAPVWTNDTSSDASDDSAEAIPLSGQLQLLADVLQQASTQLAAGSDESNNDETDIDAEPEPDPFAELHTGQAELRKLFESRIHSDEVQARTLERMHQELQASRSQLQRREMEPLLKDIIFCHDFVTREVERGSSGNGESVDWQQSFELLGQMLLDVLFKYDVEPFRSESDEFDRTMQQCVRTEQTQEPEQDKQIATYGLTGFRNEDRILRREQVTVYRYRPSG